MNHDQVTRASLTALMDPWLGIGAIKDCSQPCSYMAGMVSWRVDRLPNFFEKREVCTVFSQIRTDLDI